MKRKYFYINKLLVKRYKISDLIWDFVRIYYPAMLDELKNIETLDDEFNFYLKLIIQVKNDENIGEKL